MGDAAGIIVAYPGTGHFAQQVALSLLEADLLRKFVTTFAAFPDATWLSALQRMGGDSLVHSLRRRGITAIPRDCVATRPSLEIMRTLATQVHASPPTVDRIWDWMAHDFSRHVARRWVPGSGAIYAYEYTALEPFERAKDEGCACLLDLPSLSSREFQQLLQQEIAAFPQARSRYDHYFEALFERRQARRDREIELADVIFTNSTLTAQSHIRHGADPARIVTVPLAAPVPITSIQHELQKERPLRVLWAGTFSLGKGAHYLLRAWQQFGDRSHIELLVYGAMTLPEQLLEHGTDDIHFRGSVPQAELFRQFEQADVLLFPTLSDGFGMVVNEAFSRGLPVITTDRAGAADLVEQGKNGLIITAASDAAIRDALQWCLDNREALHAMRHKALETARAWQWSDYRREFSSKLSAAMRQAGFEHILGSVS